MKSGLRILGLGITAVCIFVAGVLCGPRLSAAAQTFHFGQPKTIVQVSLIKLRPGVSEAQKQEVVEGLRKVAGQIQGIKNIWLKTSRMQPRDFDLAFVIEFADRDAADNYALSPIHDAWSKKLQLIRETSLSPQVTN
jgi:hypothetical protein